MAIKIGGIEFDIGGDASDLEAAVEDAQRKIASLGGVADETAREVSTAADQMGSGLAGVGTGLDGAAMDLQGFGTAATETSSEVSAAANTMSTAMDSTAGEVGNASNTMSAALDDTGQSANQAGVEMEGLGTKAKDAGEKISTSGKAIDGSMKQSVLGMSQAMTSGFMLYQSVDNIEKKQYAYEKATLASKKATEAVDQAQKDYNDTVEKYGADSAQAQDALDKLNLSKETAALADEREKISQGNVNDAMMYAGITALPAVISGIDGMSKLWKNMQGLNIGGAGGLLEKIKGGLQGLGNDKIGVLGSAVTGIGALFTGFMAFNAKTPEMKAAYSVLTGALVALTLAQWASNIAAATGWSMTGVGLAIVGIGAGAAAGMYLLSQQYGPKEEAPPEDLSTTTPSGGTTPPTAPTTTRKPTGELPSVTPGAGMKTGAEMAGAGLGEYIEETGTFIPREEALVRDDVAFKVSQGPNAGKYKWLRTGVAKGTYFSMEDLKRIQAGQYTADYEQDLRPWFTYGFEERADELGNVYLVGRHFQKGGLILGDTLGMIHRDEAVLPLTDTRAMDRIAAALVGEGGGTVIQNFYINGAKDVDLIMNEIAQKMRYRGVVV
jgi:hypothetical protein